MSAFFSRRHLAARTRAASAVIEDDVNCTSCGYNLRGLVRGRACPECGSTEDASAAASRPLRDIMLSGSAAERDAFRWGFGLAATAVVLAVATRMGYFVLAAPGATPELLRVRAVLVLLTSLMWIAGVWLATPASLVALVPGFRHVRRGARLLSLAFIPGALAMVAIQFMAAPPGGGLILLDRGFRLLGGAGALCAMALWTVAASDAELERAARRINAPLWMLWAPSALGWVFPAQIAWFTLIPLGIILLAWSWLMVLLALGLHELWSHVRWAGIIAVESTDRAARIAAKRAAYDADVKRQVRPVPAGDDGDIPLDPGR